MIKSSVLLLMFISSFYQGEVWEIKNWKATPIPTTKEIDSILLNKISYTVYKDNNRVLVKKYDSRIIKGEVPPFKPADLFGHTSIPSISTLKVSNGWLIGFDHGEYGGSLLWFDDTGINNYRINRPSSVEFFRVGEKTFAIKQWSLLQGVIQEISFINGKWVSSEFIKLSESPTAITVLPNNDFLVVTKQLLLVKPNKEIVILIEDPFWKSYIPNSIIVDGQDIYIGMRGGVLKTTLSNPKAQAWLTR